MITEKETIELQAKGKYLEKEVNELKKSYHDKADQILDKIGSLFGKFSDLKCGVHFTMISNLEKNLTSLKNNDLHHVNLKLNTLLFTVLGAVLIFIIISGLDYLKTSKVVVPAVKKEQVAKKVNLEISEKDFDLGKIAIIGLANAQN